MTQLIAGLALTPACVFSAVLLDSRSESLCTKQRSGGGLSLDVAERPGGYRDNAGWKFSKPQKCYEATGHILYSICFTKLKVEWV